MIVECIHGLELSRCDVCSPKTAPVVTVAAPVTRRVAAKLRTPARPAAASRRTAGAASASTVDLGEQRIYHLTHVNNLEGILTRGAVLAPGSDAWDGVPTVDISSSTNREQRAATPVAASDGPTVAHYVPFFLTPNATLWEALRAREQDSRLTTATLAFAPAEFVILVSTVKGASRADEAADSIAVSDGDAADPHTRFGSTSEDADRVLRRLVADKESPRFLEAEFLVKDNLPFDLITLVGVANDRARDAVRATLESSPYQPRVAVYPPWFARSE